MDAVLPLPTSGCWVPDARGADRMLRVSWHHEADVAVLSFWRGDTCAGTARIERAAVPELVAALVAGLAEQAPARVGFSEAG